MTIIPFSKLNSIRVKHFDKKIVFCAGCFDLTHVGHILFFESCKNLGDLLVVGVAKDKAVKRVKGEKRPVLNQEIRIKTVDSLKPVDYCFHETYKLNQPPLKQMVKTFEILHPDIYVINDDAYDIGYRKRLTEKYHIKMVILPRFCPKKFENISTTKIIDFVARLPHKQ